MVYSNFTNVNYTATDRAKINLNNTKKPQDNQEALL